MRPVAPKMREQILVVASGIEQSIVKDSETASVQGAFRHPAFLVDALGNAGNGAVVPGEDGVRQRR